MKTHFLFQKPEPDPELSALREALAQAQDQLSDAYSRFNEAVAPELVESSVYEISAAKARCSYLIRRIKERSVAVSTEEAPQWI